MSTTIMLMSIRIKWTSEWIDFRYYGNEQSEADYLEADSSTNTTQPWWIVPIFTSSVYSLLSVFILSHEQR